MNCNSTLGRSCIAAGSLHVRPQLHSKTSLRQEQSEHVTVSDLSRDAHVSLPDHDHLYLGLKPQATKMHHHEDMRTRVYVLFPLKWPWIQPLVNAIYHVFQGTYPRSRAPGQEPASSHQPTMASPAPAPLPFMTTCQARHHHLSLSLPTDPTDTIVLPRTGRHSCPSSSFIQTLLPFTLSDQSHRPPLQLHSPPLPTSSQLPRTFLAASTSLPRHRHPERPPTQPSESTHCHHQSVSDFMLPD